MTSPARLESARAIIRRHHPASRGSFFIDGDSTAEVSARLRLQTDFHHRREIGLEFFFFDLCQIVFRSDHAIRRAGDFRLA